MSDAAPMQRWTPAYVGLGSNLDEPERQIRRAFDGLASMDRSRLVARSPAYRSAPMGPQDQPEFVNAVAGMLTMRAAQDFLSDLKTLEHRLGRRKAPQRWGPRRIDLDLLLFGGQTIETDLLTVPHPGLKQRNFVIYPLAMVAPNLVLPDGTRLDILRRATDAAGLQAIDAGSRHPGVCRH